MRWRRRTLQGFDFARIRGCRAEALVQMVRRFRLYFVIELDTGAERRGKRAAGIY
jgi:hypothetical protein